MRKFEVKYSIYALPIVGILVSCLLGFQRIGFVSVDKLHVVTKHSSGANPGYTGAPDEANCTHCHAGQVQNGDNENMTNFEMSGLPVGSYLMGESIDISVSTASVVNKKGFEMTALDANNDPAGDFVIGSNTQLKSGIAGTIIGRKYITHTSGTNSPNGWSFSWVAPANDVGPVTFYLSTNASNSSSNTNGDVIYLSQYTLANAAANLSEIKSKQEFKIGFAPATNALHINFKNEKLKGELYLNIINLKGESVFTSLLGVAKEGNNQEKVILPNDIKDGMYIANLFVGNFVMQQKIRVIH